MKKALRVVWILVLLACAVSYFLYSDRLTAASIYEWINRNGHTVVLTYTILCVVRGVTMIPSTPFIFAGVLLLPGQPWLLLAISLGCILLSSTIIYYISDYLGFGAYFEKNHKEKVDAVKQKMSANSGFWFITAWAAIPITPTDLMIYAAGSIKLPYNRVIWPMMLGELVICAVYIFGGAHILQYFI